METTSPAVLMNRAEKTILNDPKKALILSGEILSRVSLYDDPDIYFRAKFCICRAQWITGDFPNALLSAGELIKTADEVDNPKYIAKGHHISGNVYIQTKSYTKALKHFLTSLEYLKETRDLDTKSGVLNNIGEIYSELEEYDKAERYYIQCNEISSTFDNKRNFGISYLNLANISHLRGKQVKALNQIKIAKDIFLTTNDNVGIAYSVMMESDILSEMGDYNKAVKDLKKARQILLESKDKFNLMRINEKILSIYRKTGQCSDFKELAVYSIEFARTISSHEWISTFSFLLSEFHEKDGNIEKAFEYYKQAHENKTKYFDEMMEQNKKNIEIHFDVKRAEAENKLIASYNEKLEKLNNTLMELSRVDSMTQIPNRRRFTEFLNDILSINSRAGLPVGLLLIDVDHFKQYNDNYGHVNGDSALKEIAYALKKCTSRSGDFLARYGGDEFVIVLPNTDSNGSSIIAERILNIIRTRQIKHEYSRVRPYITLTIGGYCEIPNPDTTLESMVQNADRALYRAKDEGRNCFVLERSDSCIAFVPVSEKSASGIDFDID